MKKFYLIAGLGMSLIFSSSCVGLAQDKSVGISGSIEVGFEKKEEEKSNLSIGDVEVSLDVKLNDKVCGNVVLRPDTPQEILDEATIELEKFHPLPISITVGKTVMPFGIFESHLISDPLTKENWETNQVGAIVGYKGNIAKANGAIYDSSNNEDVGAFAFQLSANPTENFVIGTSYKNYPEDVGTETYTHGDVSAMFSYTKGKMTLDAEYCKATKRGEGEAKPSAYFVGCAYQTNDILELALRYEDFDDDDETTTSTNSKVSYGLNYSIVEGTTLSFEYTRNNLEQGEKDKDEFYAKLAMEF